MPYTIVKSNIKGVKGYRVRKKDDQGKLTFMSKDAKTYDDAHKQLIAIILNEKK